MKSRRTVLLVVPMIGLLLAVPAGATSGAPQWHAAKAVSLPSGATGLPNGFLPALSCSSAGNCEAGGSYLDSKGNVEGLVLNEVRSMWRAPTRLVPPANAGADPQVDINSLSCATNGNCSAGGGFGDTKKNGQSLIANEVNGAWKQAQEVTLPSNAGTALQNSQIHAVVCWSSGNCSAVGTYFDNAEPVAYARGLEVNEVRGVWGRARETLLPSDANIDPLVNVNQVACARAGNCVAVGSYITNQNATGALVLPEVNGAWKRAIALVPPGDASAYPSAALSEVTCVSPGNCTAIGQTGKPSAMLGSQLAGHWNGSAWKRPSSAARK